MIDFDKWWNSEDADNFRAQHARSNELEAELEHANQWRDLALQFDGHRMQALWHLKAMVNADTGTLEAKAAGDFLNAGPLPGEQVLAQRIAELAAVKAAPAAQAVEPFCQWWGNGGHKTVNAAADSRGWQGAAEAGYNAALRATPPAQAVELQARVAELEAALADEREKSALWAEKAHEMRGQSLRGEPVDGIIQP